MCKEGQRPCVSDRPCLESVGFGTVHVSLPTQLSHTLSYIIRPYQRDLLRWLQTIITDYHHPLSFMVNDRNQ